MELIRRICRGLEEFPWRGGYGQESDLLPELKQCLTAAAGDAAVVQVERHDYNVIKPARAFGAEHWPDAVVLVPGVLSMAIEAKLRRAKDTGGMPVAALLGQCLMYRAIYDWSLGFIYDEGEGVPPHKYASNEDVLRERLWAPSQIGVVVQRRAAALPP